MDYYWETLAEGGEEAPCGWLKDKFGLSWQVTPDRASELLADPDREGTARHGGDARMKKLDIATLERAAEQVPA